MQVQIVEQITQRASDIMVAHEKEVLMSEGSESSSSEQFED
jgi:hypothetical protein